MNLTRIWTVRFQHLDTPGPEITVIADGVHEALQKAVGWIKNDHDPKGFEDYEIMSAVAGLEITVP